MTISNPAAGSLIVLAASVGLVLPTGFSPARAVESNDANRGIGDQTKTKTVLQSYYLTPLLPVPPTLPVVASQPATKPSTKPLVAGLAPTANRSGLRVGRPKLRTTGKALTGLASYYGPGFHGRRTASGERFNMYAMTLACRRLPMGTRVRVTNLRTGKSAVARINDYGPNGRSRRRVADLSKGLANRIGLRDGLARIRLEVVK